MNKACCDPFASTQAKPASQNPTPEPQSEPQSTEQPQQKSTEATQPTKPVKDDSVSLSKSNFTPIKIRGETHYVRKGYEDSFSAPPPEKPKTPRELRKEKREQLKKERMEVKKKVG